MERFERARAAASRRATNAGGLTVFVQDEECEDMRQLRARLDDLRKKFQVGDCEYLGTLSTVRACTSLH